MDRSLPQPPVQVRALRMLNRYFPSSMERAFIVRWLEPRAKKAEARALAKAQNRLAPWEAAKEARKREAKSARVRCDAAFSIYVRTINTQPGTDGERWGHCVTCPTSTPAKRMADLQNGHCIKRGFYGTRYKVENCNPQCRTCNDPRRGNGRVPLHEAYIELRHGIGTMERLRAHAKINPRKPTEDGFREMEERFKRLTAEYLAAESRIKGATT